jgi:antitoxin (DNA-binding transcriptional repressor) of toxin-antitoxin stability system
MRHVSVAEAKAKLSEILDGVIAGDEVIITRRGKKIARIGAVNQNIAPITWEELEAELAKLPRSAGNSVVDMREQDRY